MIIRLACRGRDLTPRLAESIDVLERYGPDWLAEVQRAQWAFPGARLMHPSELPTEEQLEAMWPVRIGDK